MTVEHLVGFLQKVASKFARGRNVEDEFCDGSSPKLVLLNDECYVFNW